MRHYDNQPSGTVPRARRLRRDATDAERRLWQGLREALPRFKWRRQMPIGPYYADFACFAERLVIELDGGQHAEAGEYDAARTAFMEREGYRVLRFWNHDGLTNLDGVLAEIAANLPLPPGEGRGEGEQHSASTSPSPSHAEAWAPPSPGGRGV